VYTKAVAVKTLVVELQHSAISPVLGRRELSLFFSGPFKRGRIPLCGGSVSFP